MSAMLSRATSAILKTRAPGQSKDEWAMAAARNVFAVIHYQDGTDEEQAIGAAARLASDVVVVVEAWDAMLDEALT